MAYTPTDWVDGTTPVNAANLDKIEQGIVDAHTGYAAALAGNPPSPVGQEGKWLRSTSGAMVWSNVGAEYQALSGKGAANGYASLDAEAKVPVSQLPAVPPTFMPIDWRNPNSVALAGNTWPTVQVLSSQELWMWQFRQDVSGALYGVVRIPNGATVVAPKVYLELGATAAGTTRMHVRATAVTDGETLDFTSQDQTVIADVVLAAGRVRKSQVYTFTGMAAGDFVLVSLLHEGTHANDTLAVPTELYGGYFSLV